MKVFIHSLVEPAHANEVFARRQLKIPGFTFLASIIVIFSGAQLLALGIFGEYLARIHFRMMERPAYVVSAMTPEHTAEHRLI